MRVITGTARGRRLITLAGDAVRPTASRVKEALFSILQFELEGRRVLDLFAGSGQLGIEALSRGAKNCTFVDASRESLGVTEKNLESTGLRASAKTVLSDAVSYLDRTDTVYDIVFIDPPYRAGLLPAAIAAAAPHVAPGGVMVAETATDVTPVPAPPGFEAKAHRYGRTVLTVYRKEGAYGQDGHLPGEL